MSHDTCDNCRPNTPCRNHAPAHAAAAILATVARDARPYNASGGRGIDGLKLHTGNVIEPTPRGWANLPIGKRRRTDGSNAA